MRGGAWIAQVGPMEYKRPHGQGGKKREEGVLSRGVRAACRSCKRQGKGFSMRASQGTGPAGSF